MNFRRNRVNIFEKLQMGVNDQIFHIETNNINNGNTKIFHTNNRETTKYRKDNE